LLAQLLEPAGALDRLEAFTAHHGADFHGLARSRGRLVLVREPWQVPASYPFGDDQVVPLAAGETLAWKVQDASDAGAATTEVLCSVSTVI
jgi:dihydroorotase